MIRLLTALLAGLTLAACDRGDNGMASDTVTVAPFGSWASPISAADVYAGANSLQLLRSDGADLYWTEYRADEGGRSALMQRGADGTASLLSPPGFNVRSRVHEYGGGAFVVAGGVVYFSNFADQRLYRQQPGKDPVPLTPQSDSKLRYGDCLIDAGRNRLICVREDHRGGGEAANTLVAIDMEKGGAGTVLFGDSDFVAHPRLSPDGRQLAFVSWQHPNMPWDDTTLWLATLGEDGAITSRLEIPKPGPASLTQPRFAADGSLWFIADFSGWWNLYRWNGDAATPLSGGPVKADFASPDWGLGNRNYALLDDGTVIASYTEDGAWRLAAMAPDSGALTNIGPPFAELSNVVSTGNRVYFTAARPGESGRLWRLEDRQITDIYRPAGPTIAADVISAAEAITYDTGKDKDEVAHGFYYAPHNPRFQGPEGARPPLIVKVHGGPTGATDAALDTAIQFWTSRGFAVLDINHRGSSGFGRAFRQRLYGEWGLVDVEDAATGAEWLAEKGRVDRNAMAIRGGSAGGYTTLAALAFHNVFSAGAAYYGISDLEMLARETHKFESRYLDQLIGPYPARRDLYVARSPIHHIDGITVPLLLLQGLDDKVVPPDQSEAIFKALKEKGVPTAYLTFAGEGHGFRQPENRIRALLSELAFYGRVFGFTPAGDVPAIRLENDRP